MNNHPLISVIVPVYKVEKYLKRCIESIINQTYKNLEIILIDDGSPDKCGELCNEYAAIDKRINAIHQKNRGIAETRNVGIDNSHGEYIMFVDSDDWICLDMVSLLLEGIINTKSDSCIANYTLVEGKKPPEVVTFKNEFTEYDTKDFFENIFWNHDLMCVVPWGKLYKKELFDGIRYPAGKIHEDAYTTPKVLMNAKKIAVTMDKMYYYYQREDSIMHLDRFIKHDENFKATMSILELFKEKGYVISYIKGIPFLLGQTQKEYKYLSNVVNDKKKAKDFSRLTRIYLKLGKKIGKDYYTLSIQTKPHIYEAAYPKFMKFYWLWCGFKKRLFKK